MHTEKPYIIMNLCGTFTCYPEPYPMGSGMVEKRKTLNGPAESGYNVCYGILEAALGYANNGEYEEEIKALREAIEFEEVEAPKPKDAEGRYYRESKFTDYQTSGSAARQNGNDAVFLTAKGTKGHVPAPVEKEYLVRARRWVKVYSDQETLEMLKHALRFPYYSPYIGRACCIPTEPILVEDDHYEYFYNEI